MTNRCEQAFQHAAVAEKTIAKIEADKSNRMDPRRLKALQKLQRVLEDVYGIEFFAASENSGEGNADFGKSNAERPIVS